MNTFIKKYIYLWFVLMPMVSTASLTYNQTAKETVGLQDQIDPTITQETQAVEPYTLDDTDRALITKIRTQTTIPQSIPITLPILGSITLRSPGHDQPFVGQFAQAEDINLSPLPVLITNGTITLDNTNRVTIAGDATVFGQPTQFSLVELRKESPETPDLAFSGATLRIVFKQKPTITLFPGKAFVLNTVNLVLDHDKPPTLVAQISLFNQKITLTFGVDKNRLITSFSLSALRLGTLIPPLSTTPFAGITLKQVTFSTNQTLPSALVTPETDTVTTMTGSADFSSLTLPFDTAKINNVSMHATLSRLHGFNLTAELSDVQLPVLGHLEEARFIIDAPSHEDLTATHEKLLNITQTAATHQELGVVFKLEGKGTLTLAQQEPILYALDAEYHTSALTLTGTITHDIKFKNITIRQASFTLYPTTKELDITGESSIEGFDMEVTLAIRQPDPTKGKSVILEGTAKNATIQPFAKSGIPGLSSLTFSNVKVGAGTALGVAAAEPEIKFGATVKIFDKALATTIHFVSNDQGERGVVFEAALPEDWQFPGTSLHLSKAQVIGSTIEYTDPLTYQTYTRGLSIAAQFELSDQVAALIHRCQTPQAGKLSCPNKIITLVASFDPTNPTKTRFGAKLSDKIVSTEKVDIGPVFFYLTVETPPALLLDITLIIKPSAKDRTIGFRANAQLDPEKLTFAASLRPDDFWRNPFGIQGFAIGGLGAKLGINFAQFAATGLPSEIGLAGALQLSDKTIAMAAVFDTHFVDMALRGQLQGELSLVDLVRLFAQPLGAKIPLDKIPHIAIKNVLVKFAPKTVSIGQIVIEQGLTLQGALDIFNLSALLDFNVDITGVRAKGYTNAITLKDILFIRGDSPQGGPIFDLQFNAAQQYLHLNGSLELKNITKAKTMLDINNNGITFNFSSQFGDALYSGKPLLYAQVVGTAGTLVNPQFILAITFEQTLNRFILDQLNQSIAQSKQQVEQATATAQQQLAALTNLTQQVQQKSDSIKRSIDQAQQSINIIETHIATVNQSIAGKQQEVQTLKNDVDALQAKINDEKNRFNRLSLVQRALQSAPTGAKLAAWGTELAAKQVAYSTAKAALDAALQVSVGTLKTAEQSAQTALTAAQDFLNLFLEKAAPASITAAQSAASSILDITKKGELGVLSAGQQAGTFTLSAFDVRRVYFNSNLDSIKAGVLANVQADLRLVNQPVTLNFNLDVHNVATSIAPIIKEGQARFNKALTSANFVTQLNQLNKAPQIIAQANQALQMQLPALVTENLAKASQAIQQVITHIATS